MIVYKKTDRIKVQLGELTISLAPLTFREKSAVQDAIQKDAMSGSIEAIKFAVKDIEGLCNVDGSKYELQFDGDKLSDETVDDLSNIGGIESLFIAALNLMNSVPNEFVNPMTGKKLEGIEIVREEKETTTEKKQ